VACEAFICEGRPTVQCSHGCGGHIRRSIHGVESEVGESFFVGVRVVHGVREVLQIYQSAKIFVKCGKLSVNSVCQWIRRRTISNENINVRQILNLQAVKGEV